LGRIKKSMKHEMEKILDCRKDRGKGSNWRERGSFPNKSKGWATRGTTGLEQSCERPVKAPEKGPRQKKVKVNRKTKCY